MTFLALRPRANRSFESLYRRHVAAVYRYALAVLRNPRAAEDVTRATFREAHAALRRGERPSAPGAWLAAIAHDSCRARLARGGPREQAGRLDGDADGERAVDDIASAHQLGGPPEGGPFAERIALAMRDLEGRSYADIAATLGVTPTVAEALVFRAHRAVRDRDGPLGCCRTELAVSRHLDGRLRGGERAAMLDHLRRCEECTAFARGLSAQRAAIRSLAGIPLPAGLSSFSGARAEDRRLAAHA
jgi:RNA polymerase sigma-70 factor (ECF subfamily)